MLLSLIETFTARIYLKSRRVRSNTCIYSRIESNRIVSTSMPISPMC